MSRKTKRRILFWGSIIVSVAGLILVWAVLVEPRLIDQRRYTVRVPNLPTAWEGRTVAFITDLQLGMWLDNESAVREVLARIAAERPALLLIGGDFIYHPTEDDTPTKALEEYKEEEAEHRAEVDESIGRVTSLLKPIVNARIPVYAVLGNHDYAMENQQSLKLEWVAERLETALEEIGIKVLRNEWTAIGSPAGAATQEAKPLYLVGIGPHYPGEANVHKALASLPSDAARVVIMHNPQTFADIPAGQAPLALAGHTHGGQIRVPWLKSWSWLAIVQAHEVHADGWINDFGHQGNRLYVNRGIGFSIAPIRLNCRPELTHLTLSGE